MKLLSTYDVLTYKDITFSNALYAKNRHFLLKKMLAAFATATNTF